MLKLTKGRFGRWGTLGSAYNNSQTLMEQVDVLKEMTNDLHENEELLNQDIAQLDTWIREDGIPKEVNKKVNELVNNGEIAELINETVLTDINRKVENKADKSTVEVLKQQQASLIANAGDLTQNSELLDLRVGATATYTTAGEHVRAIENGKLKDNVLTITKLNSDLTKETSNLFNKYNATIGSYVNQDGSMLANANLVTSDFIPVTAGDTIHISKMRIVAQYGTNGEFVEGLYLSDVLTPSNYKLKIVAPITKIRVSTPLTHVDDFMIARNEVLPLKSIPNRVLNKKLLPVEEINAELENKYFTRTDNLFNSNDYKEGYLETNGTILANANYLTTHLIPVTQGDVLRMTNMRTLAMYDTDGIVIPANFIADATNPSPYHLTVPSGVGYIAISFRKSTLSNYMVVKNKPLGTYQPYRELKQEFLPAQTQGGGGQSVNLPNKIWVTTGDTLLIRNRNITRDKDIQVDYNVAVGTQTDVGYQHTFPTPTKVELVTSIYDKGNMLGSRTSEIIVSAPRSSLKKVLLIGDSTVSTGNQGLMSKHIKDTLGSNVTMLGTQGTSPYNHEGRPGWTASQYNTNASYNGVVNPFYNPTTQGFDLNYYLQQTGIAVPDVVIFQLGINDTFNSPNIVGNLQAFNKLLDNIKTNNPTIKLALNVTIPPNDSQNAFGGAYGVGQTQWRYKYNNYEWVEAMLLNYGITTDLIPTHISINTTTQFTDGVHPNEEGYKEMAKHVVAYLNGLV